MQAYSIIDLIVFPFYSIMFYMLFARANKKLGLTGRSYKLLTRALAFRYIFVILFFAIMQFYYGYGDSFLYYGCIEDILLMAPEVKNEFLTSPLKTVEPGDAMFYSFTAYRGYYMANLPNAVVVKIGYWLSFLCGNSYITLCLFFSVFAFAGCRLLYILFTSYYPHLSKEFSIATLYLPTLCFWSSGLLKDSLTLGAVGILIYYAHKLFVSHKFRISYVLWAFISIMLLITIKAYILLALLPGLVIWLFRKNTVKIKNPQMRRNMSVVMVIVGLGVSFLLISYLGSTQFASDLATEKLDEEIIKNQEMYVTAEKGGSYFDIGTKNIFLAFPLGIVATLFRPFIWEVRSAVMMVSSLESLFFILMTGLIFFRVGFFGFFRRIFSNPDTLFFFIFTILFAGGVGASTANFGSLVRYKIPCLPFYLMLLFILIAEAKIRYPFWLSKIMGHKMPKQQLHVQ